MPADQQPGSSSCAAFAGNMPEYPHVYHGGGGGAVGTYEKALDDSYASLAPTVHPLGCCWDGGCINQAAAGLWGKGTLCGSAGSVLAC
jgi:hypothetical protein